MTPLGSPELSNWLSNMILEKYIRFLILLFLNTYIATAQAGNYNFLSFNLESKGANIQVLSKQIEQLSEEKDVDIWLFSDIQPDWTDEIANAVAMGSGSEVDFIPRNGGIDNRFLIVFNKERFNMLYASNPELGDSHSNHLITMAKFRESATGKSFVTLLNASAPTDYSGAYLARDVNNWAKDLTDPVIAFGHFNFEWPITKEERFLDPNYRELVGHSTFRWVRPAKLIPTYCEKQDEIFDFVFTSGTASGWKAQAEIIPMSSTYCNNHQKNLLDSNHRPIYARFKSH